MTSPPAEASPSRPSSTSSATNSRASSSEVLAAHPLLSTSPALEPYPVYSRHAKRLSQASAESLPPQALSLSPPVFERVVSVPPPLAPTASQSTSSPLPPLVSRPSSSSFPAGNRRPARSVSEATRSLRKAKVEGDVQQLGLAMESGGAAMVVKLAGLGKEPEWAGVLAALAAGKVTLCLPAEKLPAQAFLTPAFFLDHLAVIDPAPAASTSTSTTAPPPPPPTQAFATLSGFRGTISSESIDITSCGTAIFESPQGLFKPGSLAAPPFADYNFHLGVLGVAIPTPPPAPSTFPSFAIVSPLSDLSIPRHAPRSAPPVPSERRMESIGRAAGATGSRLAALFAKSAPSASFDDLPPIVPLPPGLLPSTLSPSPEPIEPPPTPPRPSIPNLELSVLGIDKIIRHADVARSVGRSLDLSLRDSLRSVDGLEESALVPDAVCAFAARFQPPLGWTTSLFTPGKFPPAPDSLFTKDATDISEQFQNLVHGTREELSRVLVDDDRVDAALERVEEVVTGALYDRIFSPHSSGDQQADENLASRIAALNMLELSLDHLGIDLAGGGLDEWNDGQRTIRDSLEDIIGFAGKELGRLQDVSVRSPAAKLAVFVNIHKIIVEGLGRLPAIPLKESTDSTPFTVRKVGEVEVEMDDAASRSRSRSQSQSRADSPTSTELAELPTINLPVVDLETSMHEASLGSVFDVTPRASPPPTPSSSSSADLILPLLIYLVVQWNPPRLPSTLAFIQRFRSDQLLRGEASYCVTNLHAVCEFLSSVDISALGLSSQKIGGGFAADALLLQPTAVTAPAGGKLKGRVSNVTQELDQFVDTANSAIAGVVDSSFRMLFGARGLAPKTIEDVKNALDGAGNSVASRARGSLLRRATSPASLQLPVTEAAEGVQREMVDITAPPPPATDDEDEDARSVRSVRSVSSFLRTRDASGPSDERPSIGERLASIASLQRFGGDSKSATSPAATASPASSPAKPFVPSTIPARRPTIVARSPSGTVAPIQRFLDCEVADIRLGDVSVLLSEYRKLAAEVARLGALLEGDEAEANVEGGV